MELIGEPNQRKIVDELANADSVLMGKHDPSKRPVRLDANVSLNQEVGIHRDKNALELCCPIKDRSIWKVASIVRRCRENVEAAVQKRPLD